MSRLIVVSNRLPVTVTKGSAGLRYAGSVGGLATGLQSVSNSYALTWVGWPGTLSEKLTEQDKDEISQELAKESCWAIHLSKRQIENYYQGFCNKTLWPLFHYFPQYTVYEERYWQGYEQVNEMFCDRVAEIAGPDDRIWVHDYQLMLLPKMIRQKLPQAQIGFFLHIPFPSFELFRLLSWREELLEGLLGADVIGFHTYDYVRHFLSSSARIMGAEHSMGSLRVENRLVKVDAFPMGIDYERYAGATENAKVRKNLSTIRKKFGARKIILSIDRLDYTKGIIERLEAFDLFLSQNPEYKEQVTLILLAVPSRAGVEYYKELREHLETLVGRINGEHGTLGWVPVWYLYRAIPWERLAALYSVADVALVTPLRDGMNLVAKEFIATKADARGVLILSEMAGAASELGEAVIVNAHDKAAIIRAIKEALQMPVEEQIERNRLMQARLCRYTVARWAGDFLETLADQKKHQQELAVRKLTRPRWEDLTAEYRRSSNRLLLLDYDGTLVSFVSRPEKAGPDESLLALLEALAADSKNEVVIVSGRERATLDRWLGKLNISLIAEHGAWIKGRGNRWLVAGSPHDDWKSMIRPVLELYRDRTAGSFIEEKDYSLVWHFRKSDPDLAYLRSQELKGTILNLTASLDIGVFEGNKILEVKGIGISKGQAAEAWLNRGGWDFIFAAGDDYTDEDLFSVLPKSAYSIKVGHSISKARFNLDMVSELRMLLEELANM
jgi:trehalose 6-phosphate synthase/phosphatase